MSLPSTGEQENLLQHQAIDIPNSLHNQQRPTPNLPCGDLLRNKKEFLEICVPLYEASISGDWEYAKAIIDKREEVIRFSITENHDTALHIATLGKRTKFVENLVNLMEKEDLELQNKNYDTALCLAAVAGSVELAEIMVKNNRRLLNIPGSQEMMPLHMAALYGRHKMVKYLYENSQKMSGDYWTPQNRGQVLLRCVEADLFDVALDILDDCPDILDSCEESLNGQKGLPISADILKALARNPVAFKKIKPPMMRFIDPFVEATNQWSGFLEEETEVMQLLRIVWENVMEKPTPQVDDIIRGPTDNEAVRPVETESQLISKRYSSQVLFVAAEMGNTRFLVELISSYPDLIWKRNDDGQSLFHIAVSNRYIHIYNLLCKMGTIKYFLTPLKDDDGNNMLHLVAKIAKEERLQNIPGVALQMQIELLWFKQIEAMVPPLYREMKNNDGLTPSQLFTKEHKDLLARGEKWMKVTAAQSMVVAALVATIVSAAAFTVPGGYNQETGIPLFSQDRTFMIFVISDAIALSLSSGSILASFSILISRYSERDFLISLPRKFGIVLSSLVLALVSMMIAFSVSSFILYQKGAIWVPILVTAFAMVPVYFFGLFQYPLLVDVLRMTYGARYLFKPYTGNESRKLSFFWTAFRLIFTIHDVY